MSRRKSTRRPLALETLEVRCNPGGGTFIPDGSTSNPNDGTFNFVVSMRFAATTQEIDKVKEALRAASDALADATDDQHRFGQVTIVNNSEASNEADIWVVKAKDSKEQWMVADGDGFGRRGKHMVMPYFTRPDITYPFWGGDVAGIANTVVHEWGHLAYTIADEYHPDGKDPLRPKTNGCAMPAAEGTTLNFSLMDAALNRGSRKGVATGPVSLNEFCVPGTHDRDNDNNQTLNNKKSAWEQIAGSRFPATMPAGLPVDAAPASKPVTFITDATGLPHTMLVLDMSGLTLFGGRFQMIKEGAKAYVSTMKDGESVGIVVYGQTATVQSPLMKVNSAADRTLINQRIDAITNSGFLETDIFDGLTKAAQELNSARPLSANKVILLIGGGFVDSDHGPLGATEDLKRSGISVLSVLAAPNADAFSQTVFSINAQWTGGKYYALTGNDPAAYLALAAQVNAERSGEGILMQAPPYTLGTGEVVPQTVEIPTDSGPVVLAVTRLDPSDQIVVTLTDPDGQPIISGPGVESFDDGTMVGFRIANPAAGNWTITATAGTISTGQILFVGLQQADPIRVNVDVMDDAATFPEPLTVQVTPTYRGQNVVGASVFGAAVAPDGMQIPLFYFDDGLPAHGDYEAGDGVYSVRFNGYTPGGNGSYSFVAQVGAFGATTYVGESLTNEPITPPPSLPVPNFTRTGSAYAVVSGVPAAVVPIDLTAFAAPAGPTSIAVVVQNNGTVAATGVRALAYLPGDLKVLSGVPDRGTFAIDGSHVTFDVATLAPGETATLVLTVLASHSGNHRVSVEVHSTTQTDPFLENNEFAAPIPIARLERLAVGADRGSGLVSAYDPTTQQQTLFSAPFGPLFDGGVRVAAADVTGDGVPDTIAGAGPGALPQVVVYDGLTGQELRRVTAFEEAFTGGVYVAVGDFNDDGIGDIVITPDEGGGPRVLIFDGRTGAQLANFFGIDDQNFRGGARAAVGDLDGDGRADLIVAAGFGGGPRVTGWKNADVIGGAVPNLNPLFNRFVFEQSLRNGTFVAAGDVNGDGFADLIAGGGPGGGPRVQIWDAQQLISIGQEVVLGNFFGGNTDSRGGIRVTSKDVDGDGRADVLVGAGTGAGSRVTAYLGATITPFATPPAAAEFDSFPGFPGGVFVG